MRSTGGAAPRTCKRLAETWMLPVSPTHRRPHLFDAGHRQLRRLHGHPRAEADLLDEMKKADLLVALGERITDSVSQSYTFPAGAAIRSCRWCMCGRTPTRSAACLRPDLGMARRTRTAVVQALLAARRAGWRASATGWVAGLQRHPPS
jgi:acetolactate synthase-1/2/3 large subunit